MVVYRYHVITVLGTKLYLQGTYFADNPNHLKSNTISDWLKQLVYLIKHDVTTCRKILRIRLGEQLRIEEHKISLSNPLPNNTAFWL